MSRVLLNTFTSITYEAGIFNATLEKNGFGIAMNTFLSVIVGESGGLSLLFGLWIFCTPTAFFSPRASLHNLAVIIVVLNTIHSVNAFCECGYTFNSLVDGSPIAYSTTDLIESDFFHIKDVFKDTDWSVQGYSVDAIASRGTYGYVPIISCNSVHYTCIRRRRYWIASLQS
jgi:hypothetical protein